jgi:hypothetical protein
MGTEKQIAASRANGALSKGPVSIQGKRNSSRNSLRHGLLARTIVLEEESTNRFLELLRALMDEFQPSSATQLMLVETMAAARWRQLRIWGLQKVALDREIALQDPALGPAEVRAALAFKKSADALQPDLLLRYEIAYDRQFNRALKQLLALQATPAAQPAEPYLPGSLPSHTFNTTTGEENPSPEPLLHPPVLAAQPSPPERTQQSVHSTHPLHSVPLPNPAPAEPSFTQT